MTSNSEVHYVAHLKIEKVSKATQVGPNPPKRDTTEVTQLTIKADTLANLTRKLGSHITIIEEE